MSGRYWLETLGCPKNQVDSDKLAGLVQSQGYTEARGPGSADLVVLNTCAFIEQAREESIGRALELAGARKQGAKLVVTGCLAERYGDELAQALPEVDIVAGFGDWFVPEEPGGASQPVKLLTSRPQKSDGGVRLPAFDLLNLPRPAASAPWAYVKVAEGCDRRCGFCAIPSFRGPQRSRDRADILAEVEALGAQEIVLVAQDLVSWGRDATGSPGARRGAGQPGSGQQGRLVELLGAVGEMVERVRLLYLYPSGLNEELVDAIGGSGCPYYDLSLQHVSRPLLRRMRRFGDAERFRDRIAQVRRKFPDAAMRSSFIVGYPGETEADHDQLLAFLAEARLDWAGFFPFSSEEGTYAAGLDGEVPAGLVAERTNECSELQVAITEQRRADLVGTSCRVLVDAPGEARSHREAPEIDGILQVPRDLAIGNWVDVEIIDAVGPDLIARPVSALPLRTALQPERRHKALRWCCSGD